ncbi:MAG: T9SS type A sorting domain-containing protein [Crocinitomicaceae bacterium]|nr:T9SS type A sorting domain-containing protein [Crocinitomicaceae bacterium]
MKNLYLLIPAICAGTFSFAQPILTQGNVAPAIGDNFTYKRCDWDNNPGGAGAGITWDFSGLVETATANVDYVDPSTCPSPSSFPNANVAGNWGAGTQYEYFNSNSTSLDREGIYASGTAIPYSDPETILTFPFTYSDSYVDQFSGTFTSGVVLDRAGSVTVTADGYGTLILPNATIPGVLRVKVSEDYGDSYNGTEMYHYNTDVYMFYKPGVHLPVLAFTHYVQGTTTIDYGNFIDDPSLGTAKETDLTAISIYPNPATDNISFNWNGHQTLIDKIEVYDIAGKLMYTSNQIVTTIDLSTFQSGTYFIHFWEGDNREIRKFIKS